MMMKNIFSKQSLLVWIVCLAVALIFQSPHLYAFLKTPEGYVFAGQAAWFDPWDINVYISAIKWAQKFGLYFQNTYTTIDHKSIIFYPLYTTIGILFRSSNPIILYSIAKVVAGVLLVYSIYKLALVILADKKKALITAILASFAGGLGGLFYGTIYLPDISITPFILYSAFEKPHEALAISFYLFSLAKIIDFLLHKSNKDLYSAGILFVPVILFYPYYLLSYYLLFALICLRFGYKIVQSIKAFLPIAGFTLPVGIAYSWYLLSSDGFRNVTSPYLGTPHPLYMIFGYGVFVVVLLFGVSRAFKDNKVSILYLWFFLHIILSYTPLSFARYYLRALFVPLSILLVYIFPDITKRFSLKPRVLIATLCIFLFATNAVIYLGRLWRVRVDMTYYIPNEEMTLIAYLDTVPAGSGILSGYELGNRIPSYTANRVYYGHTFQTPNSGEKIVSLTAFYENKMTESEAYEFLIENNIRYVVWGKEEQEITTLSGVGSMRYEFLTPVFDNDYGVIYKIIALK